MKAISPQINFGLTLCLSLRTRWWKSSHNWQLRDLVFNLHFFLSFSHFFLSCTAPTLLTLQHPFYSPFVFNPTPFFLSSLYLSLSVLAKPLHSTCPSIECRQNYDVSITEQKQKHIKIDQSVKTFDLIRLRMF